MTLENQLIHSIKKETPSFNKGDLEVMEDGRLRADHYREAFYVSNKDRIDAIKSKKNIGFIADLIGGMRASNQKEFKMYGVSIGQDQFQDALWLYLNDQEKYGDNSDFEINGWFLINKNVA